ncbi:MAG: hypothetical protein R3D26_09865 [Cyanobacteriota/Melainabacteria group bacterium]
MAFRSGIVHKDRAVFLYSFAILSFLSGSVFGKHLAIHYTIYSTLFICLGAICLFIWLTKLGADSPALICSCHLSILLVV